MGKPIGAIFRKRCSYAVRSGIKFSGAPLVEESGSAKGPGERAEPRLKGGRGLRQRIGVWGLISPFSAPSDKHEKHIGVLLCTAPQNPAPLAPRGRSRAALPARAQRDEDPRGAPGATHSTKAREQRQRMPPAAPARSSSSATSLGPGCCTIAAGISPRRARSSPAAFRRNCCPRPPRCGREGGPR